jgi:hypothetical protein
MRERGLAGTRANKIRLAIMRTLGKWLAIAMGIYLAIAVIMNAVEPARREKAEQDAKASATLPPHSWSRVKASATQKWSSW